jgi:hypothetical protein
MKEPLKEDKPVFEAEESKTKLEKIKQSYVNEIGEYVNLSGEGGDFTAKLLYEIFDFFKPHLKVEEKEVDNKLFGCDLPENMPLYKDSGLWQLRTDDMNEVIIYQEINESFIDFISRCEQYNREEILKP